MTSNSYFSNKQPDNNKPEDKKKKQSNLFFNSSTNIEPVNEDKVSEKISLPISVSKANSYLADWQLES